MALSLRNVARTRYGITGRFSVRGNVLGKLNPTINFRTAEGEVSLLLILTPPLKATIVSFTPTVAQGTGGVTLTWHVEPPTPWLARNTQIALFTRPSEVFLPEDLFLPLTRFDLPFTGSHGEGPHLGTTTYRLMVMVMVQGGMLETMQDVSVTITQQGPTVTPTPPSAPPSMARASQVELYNCSTDHRYVYIWLRDLSMNTQENLGQFPPQYDITGMCPGDASPYVITFPNPGHLYEVVAVDPEMLNCNGQDDPTNYDCRRWYSQTLISSADGPIYQGTIP